MESQGSNLLRIPEGKTPIYILNSEYADGYAHWVKVKGGGVSPRVVCAGGIAKKGWDPDECPLCAIVASLYRKAKSIEAKRGETEEVKALRKTAGNIRAKYEAHFLAVKGELVKVKVKGGKSKKVPDFEDGQVGVLSFTRQQFEDFIALRKSAHFPFMKNGEDLTNRILILDKAKRGKSTYATTDFIPAKRTSDPPEVEYDEDEDEFNLEEAFEVDEIDLDKAADLFQKGGKEPEDDDVDEDVDFEEDDDDEDVDDDFLDDDNLDDDDKEEVETVKEKKSSKKKKSTSKKKKR